MTRLNDSKKTNSTPCLRSSTPDASRPDDLMSPGEEIGK